MKIRKFNESYIDERVLKLGLELFKSQEALDLWLNTYQDSLGPKKPIDLIDKGKVDDVLKLLDQMMRGDYD
jgi:uncharacterized protein (DUF2384 family)